jgi:hypothetical protein
MKTLFIAIRAILFGTGFVFLWGWVALSLQRCYDSTLGFPFSGWTPALGIAVMAVGGILAFACIATFVIRGEGTPAPWTRRASSWSLDLIGSCAIPCISAVFLCS